MVQFGNSVAHHLRNSSTGCKMAIELMAEKNPAISNSENYEVATRQLELMDSYIKKFLMLSKSQDQLPFSDRPATSIKRCATRRTLFLLRPNAEHLGVKLSVDSESDGSSVNMCREDAEQLMINLISNGSFSCVRKPIQKEMTTAKLMSRLRCSQWQIFPDR